MTSNSRLLQILEEEKSVHMPGGLWHELQIKMTYNSNRIEGVKLSTAQVRSIFETSTVYSEGALPVDDIIETVNHFRAIDYVIDHAEDPLPKMPSRSCTAFSSKGQRAPR